MKTICRLRAMAPTNKRKLTNLALSPQARFVLEAIATQRTAERGGKPASMTAVMEDALLAFAVQLGVRVRRSA